MLSSSWMAAFQAAAPVDGKLTGRQVFFLAEWENISFSKIFLHFCNFKSDRHLAF